MAGLLVLMMVIMAVLGGSDATWCICRQDVSQAAQQKTLDYACGAGADCNPILQNGICYNPNTVNAHCSYAANSYYQRKGQVPSACDFTGTANIASTDPSPSGTSCTYPATPSAAGSSSTPTGTPPGTPSTVPGTGPGTLSPPGGIGTSPGTGTGTGLPGLGPSGTTISTDGSDGALYPNPSVKALILITLTPIIFLNIYN